jgi:hypothetical protein
VNGRAVEGLGVGDGEGVGVGDGTTDGEGEGSSLGDGVGSGLGDGGGGIGASAEGVTVCPSKDGSGNSTAFLFAIAISMKSFQIAAGMVPPYTCGTPSMFSRGICPFGKPTQTQAAIWTV